MTLQRTISVDTGGDTRLQSRCSCGVGGHVDRQDGAQDAAVTTASLNHNDFDSYLHIPNKGYKPISSINLQTTLQRALLREVAEELGADAADLQDLRLQALIYEGQSAVGRVHLGVLYTALWLPDQAPQPMAGEALQGLGFRAAQAIANDDQFELWSRLAA